MNRIKFVAALAAFGLAAMIFALSAWATFLPLDFDRRVEWAQLKVQALLPAPTHPAFVPTPLVFVPEPEPTVAPVTPESTAAPDTPEPTAAATRTRPAPTATRRPTPKPTRVADPSAAHVALTDFRHDYQRFNNCAPTTLSIDLSHFGQRETQYDLAPLLKGNSDDKNVSPDEIVALAHTFGLQAIARVDGSTAEIKSLVAQGIPVMIETWFVPRPSDASGHYRLITGYDDGGSASTHGVGLSVEYDPNYPTSEDGFLIAQDAYIGPNAKLPYRAMDLDWRVFNRTYLVIYTDAQAAAVRSVVGDEMDDATMYAHARDVAQREVSANANDPYAWFNLGSSLVGLGRYADAAGAFDKARVLKLPWRMLWYQFGPYEAYYRAGRNAEVIALADATLATTNGLEESLYYRGLAQLALGQKDAARASFQQAVQANAHYARAKQALSDLGG